MESRSRGLERLSGLRQASQLGDEMMAEHRQRFGRLSNNDSKPKVFSSFNLFPTPPDLATRVVKLADIEPHHRILEPSAGTGNLIRALYQAGANHITAVEIDTSMCEYLRGFVESVHCADFLAWSTNLKFDRIVMNPPFKNGSDIKHIKRAIELLAPGGKLVSICANGPRQREQLKPIAKEWIELPRGSFKSEATNVETAVFVCG
jgi:16S rRNA G1207 methylase RsmC